MHTKMNRKKSVALKEGFELAVLPGSRNELVDVTIPLALFKIVLSVSSTCQELEGLS